MVVPLVTTTLGVNADLWETISRGLASGLYERVGGVIRNARTKEIVTWLRSTSDDLGFVQTPIAALSYIPQLTAAVSVLNLSITAIGFAVVVKRINAIEQRLASVSKSIEAIGRKLDLTFCGNFRAAVELARTAFAMTGATNRQVAATQAINRLLEAEHQYLGLIDFEFDQGAWAASALLSTYSLASATAARCYIELGEPDTARRHLSESGDVLEPRVKRLHDAVIGVNPAIFLHPALADEIPLERLANMLRRDSPGVTGLQVFETLRERLWETASRPAEPWLKKLPAALWQHELDGKTNFGPVRLSMSSEDMLTRVLPRLSDAFTQVEHVHEGLGCLRAFEAELAFLSTNKIEYEDWKRLESPNTGESIFLVVPLTSELLRSPTALSDSDRPENKP